MGNVNMEASQINDRTGSSKMSVAQHLKELDALASKIEGLPTFTSNDKAFLEELPAFPTEDGSKVLTATTSSGATVLSYEEVESGAADFSTTEHETGLKWIDGRKIYSVTVDNTSDLVIQSNTWTDTILVKGSIDLIIAVLGTSNGGSTFPLAGDKGTTNIRVNSWRNDTVSVRYMTFYYVKTTN